MPGAQRNATSWIFAAVLFAAAIPLAIAFLTPRDPWFDEAMLLANLRELSPLQAFDAMPFYEQAAPTGYVSGAKLFSLLSVAAGEIYALRFFSLCVGLAGVALLARIAWLEGGTLMAVGVAVLALASPAMLRYFTEIKQYSLDFTTTCLVLFYGRRLAYSDTGRNHLAFIVAAGLAALCSFVAPIAIAASLVGACVGRLAPQLRRPTPDAWRAGFRFAGSAFLCAVILTVIYLFYYRPVMELQTVAYPDILGRNFLAARGGVDALLLLTDLARYLMKPVPLATHAFEQMLDVDLFRRWGGVLTGLGLLAAAIYVWPVSRFCASAAVAGVVVIVALNLAGRLPITSWRHFIFYAPLSFLLVGAAIVRLSDQLAVFGRAAWPRKTYAVMLLVLAAGATLVAAGRIHLLDIEEVSPLLATIRETAPEVPVWVYFGAQPAVRVLAPDIRSIGLFDPRSSTSPWFVRGGGRDPVNIRKTDAGYAQAVARLVAPLGSVWLLFTHIWDDDEREVLAAVARGGQACQRVAGASDAALYRCMNPAIPGAGPTSQIAP